MNQPLQGKHIAFLVEEEYEDLELWYPLLRMEEAGAQTTIIGMQGVNHYKGNHGYDIAPNVYVQKIKAEDFDGLIIPGGYAPLHLRRHTLLCGLVREMYEAEKVVVLIGNAGWVAISADIVQGKQMTSTVAIKDDLLNAGARWIDQATVQDGQLLTARKAADLPELCQMVIAALNNSLTNTTSPQETINTNDPVDEATWESFPASDPPPY